MPKPHTKWLPLIASAFLAVASPAFAQDSGPLIDILVKKGIVTDQEAEELRADLVKDFAANTSAGKLNLGATLTELRISGDLRARYESRSGLLPNDDSMERDRFRYRLRTSLAGKLLNNWSFGVRLETATGSRSSNVTKADEASGAPFAKGTGTTNNDGLYVGQVFINWAPTPELNFTVGRMANPIVTTSMVWDGDINPEGLAEQFRHRQDKIEYFATAGQFLYSAASTQGVFAGAAGSNVKDLVMLAWQGGVKYYVEGATNFFQVAPVIYNYVNTSQAENPAAVKGAFTPTNAAATNNLFIIEVPIEYNWVTAGGVPARVFADVAINSDGSARARKFGRPDLDGEDKAYTVGFQYGKATNPGEWDARIAWQSVGAFALDPNLVDSDLFDSRTNMQGWYVGGNYALGSATQLSLTLAGARRQNDSLIAPGAGDIGSNNNLDSYLLLQVDLNVKF